jgi:signal transduction histidine kinase
MSHELRTPLNAIIGFSETMLNFPMMYDNQTLPPAYKSDMTQIYTSGKHLLQLINDILDLSKVDAGRLEMEIEQVELDPVFRGILSTAAGLIGDKPIQLLRDTPASIPTVRGDSLRIRQVILNLLSNAAKFTDQGSITVGARDNGKNEVLIWVKDTGIGIPPQDMDKIFEEFRQGASGRRKGRAGSGLGLAISRQLMNLMGGRIWVESKLNEGSTFYLTLPIFVPEPVKEQQG